MKEMVTCKLDTQSVALVPKMNSVRTRKPSSNSSGFRLLDGDHLETSSSVSRNSIYKLKIDLMFDDTRSIRSNRLDDPRGSHRTRSIIMYGRSELASTGGGERAAEGTRSIASFLQKANETSKILSHDTTNDVQRINNTVQEQIEQLFTDVAKDATTNFAVMYLGSLPMKNKVTSLQGLQEPLRELYLKELMDEKQNSGYLDICTTGLRLKINNTSGNTSKSNNDKSFDENVTPFHNIAVWSAVKFVVSDEDGGAAFLPLITDPENIDKTSLFQPLSVPEQKLVESNNAHAPIFAVVMRSAGVPKALECHGFICKSTEDAIVIAATLYQSLMAHVNSNTHRSTKRRTPRNQNGVSCISIASSSALTGSNYLSHSQIVPNGGGRKSSFRSSAGGAAAPTSSRSGRKKRTSNSSLNSSSNIINETVETSTEERKRKSHKSKRAPPVPITKPGTYGSSSSRVITPKNDTRDLSKILLDNITAGSIAKHNGINNSSNSNNHKSLHRSHHNHSTKKTSGTNYRASEMIGGGAASTLVAAATAASSPGNGLRSGDTNGDILTRVAIPRSGSFLNTGGLTRYKSRAARRHSGKLGGGGGGGSPLGFSELFNEFRLHENLHSLDDILYAIIDADGMSFNDLKPIYKEFLLKLAVTLTKDELFQRSKNIMRRQRKKKLKRKTNSLASQTKTKTQFFGAKNLKKVFRLGQFQSCRGKPPKPPRNKDYEKRKPTSAIVKGSSTDTHNHHRDKQQEHNAQHQQRARVATSGSDVSVVRNENNFHGLNRNSSSGYVSCSECSYDSEACTCISADRCYCSLRKENKKIRRKNERNSTSSKNKNDEIFNSNGNNIKRHSLISCKSDDKCYCSMVEEEPNIPTEEESLNNNSDTTWCDTDSCVSTSKCYCKRSERRAKPTNSGPNDGSPRHRSRSAVQKPIDKLALDYELFTISGNSKALQPHEALSVKKSVEAAAIFADVKLSQTTDIKSMCPPSSFTGGVCGNIFTNSKSTAGSCRSKKYSYSHKKRESHSIDRKNECHMTKTSLSSSSSQKSCSADDLLSKLNAMEKAIVHATASIKSNSSKNRELIANFGLKENSQSHYQSMRAVSASLEDTLGYLP